MIWHAGVVDLDEINRMNSSALSGHIGIEFVDYGTDWLAARMPVDYRTVQPFGRLHGGASVALSESVASAAATLTLDPLLQTAVGLEINANHVRPVGAGYVTATARPEARQRTTQIWSVRIVDDADRLVCISRITLAVIPAAKREPR
jgi:1,4-dihydroxy-2-naphthoyl-CoA hydrolase